MSLEIGGAEKPRPYRSYSAFTSWLRCGEAFRLERIIKVPEVPAFYLIAGSTIHELTEQYDRQLYKNEGR